MAARKPTPEKEPGRKRKAHTKSRGGCGNCKMRRVKCDEVKPCCRRCKTFGVSCTYDRSSSTLQPYAEAAFLVDMPRLLPAVNQAVAGALNESLRRQDVRNRAFLLGAHDLALLRRFRRDGHDDHDYDPDHDHDSGPPRTSAVLLGAPPHLLAFQRPFLLHVVLTMALLRDREQLLSRGPTRPVAKDHDRHDAVWLAAALLACTALACRAPAAPEDVWPLRAPSPSDLTWLHLPPDKADDPRSGRDDDDADDDDDNDDAAAATAAALRREEAEEEVWRHRVFVAAAAATTTAAAAHHHHHHHDHHHYNASGDLPDATALAAVPPALRTLCGVDDPTAPPTNPYHAALLALGQLVLATESSTSSTSTSSSSSSSSSAFTALLARLPPGFHALLDARDARALAVLLHVYARAGQRASAWAGWRERAVVEGRAVLVYLETWHADVPGLGEAVAGLRSWFWGRAERGGSLVERQTWGR